MDEDLLDALSPGGDFSQAGTEITVAQVQARGEKESVSRIAINKDRGSLSAFDDKDELVAFWPASIGSSGMPSPRAPTSCAPSRLSPSIATIRRNLNFSGVKAEELAKMVKTGATVTFEA